MQLTGDPRALFLLGGTGRAAVKGKESRLDCASESSPLLPPGFDVSSVLATHWSGPLLHRLGIKLQPGEC